MPTEAGAVAGIAGGLWPPTGIAAPKTSNASKAFAAQLHRSFSEERRRYLCFVFSDLHRHNVVNNWLIIGKPINQPLTPPDRQDLVQPIFRMLHSPEFAERAMEQMVHDSEGKGFNAGTSVALFRNPENRQIRVRPHRTSRHPPRRRGFSRRRRF